MRRYQGKISIWHFCEESDTRIVNNERKLLRLCAPVRNVRPFTIARAIMPELYAPENPTIACADKCRVLRVNQSRDRCVSVRIQILYRKAFS